MTTSKNIKIVVVDDEISVCRFLRLSLQANEYEVIEANTGREGLQRIIESRPNLVILDYGLPDMTGIQVLKELRTWSSIPVIFLTVRDQENDKIEVLDNGADDYITKPFGVPELLARIRLALRHAHVEDVESVFKYGLLEIDRVSHIIKLNDQEVKFTATEYALLCLLAKHVGKLVSHRQILKEIWGPNSVEHDHYLRVYFGQIRKKLEITHNGSGNLIENVSGMGYRLRII